MATAILSFLSALVKQGGSDLHISVSTKPMIRVDGDLRKLNFAELTSEQVEAMVNEITNKEQQADLIKKKSIDFSIKAKGIGIFRVNVFYQRHGLAGVFRSLSESAPTLEELKLPDIFRRVCGYANGLVLVTGPTGSGKSTTLASMVDYINRTTKGHILTLEDPIEFQHDSKMCMMNQRQLKSHFTDFSSALKAALREDPDVILVGEMRDAETIGLAITAAETGHLVFATLHTNSAAKAVDRIIDSFPGEQQNQIRTMLSESLRLVASQKLIPKKGGKGRIALHDLLVCNSAVANLIREGKIHQIPSVMQTSKRDGMQVFDQKLLETVELGLIDGEIAWDFANDKANFDKFLPSSGVGTNATATSHDLKKAG